MPIDRDAYQAIRKTLGEKITLVAVSKTKTVEDILALFAEGQRDFGENYVQELTDKRAQLPAAIRWHFIGHLQSNKVKHIISFVYLIHGVDSLKLLNEINKQAAKIPRVVDVLLQVHIAREETKFGLDAAELAQVMETVRTNPEQWAHIRVRGLMGMASNTEDISAVVAEFRQLKGLLDQWFPSDGILSMGMSGDYQLAVKEGSTMVRIGSLLFGKRG
ncbi:MAG TPA: YggS family pyridoxal phosphate-dependent enzyme [Puia sp.]|uniref:YggS family pyridoxal phosphate-dependent enzyme n=1 Tax=Puia sp. TaxID=2045100 RepID=UPI002C246249|nr:YggS family pyridoxal phosphate-dependent enzyme [Puia sp.]HVU96729.1 YggS family pyridoxal phosphate-dependent enzyme [Puia sp.]